MVRLLCHLPGIQLAVLKPYRVIDSPSETLVDMVRPAERWLAFLPIVRLVKHVATIYQVSHSMEFFMEYAKYEPSAIHHLVKDVARHVSDGLGPRESRKIKY